MEELTIGPWKADRYRVNTGEAPILQPVGYVYEVDVPLVAAYGTFRQIESFEIDEMPSEALAASRVLTVTVARVGCADAPENRAEDAIRECQAPILPGGFAPKFSPAPELQNLHQNYKVFSSLDGDASGGGS